MNKQNRTTITATEAWQQMQRLLDSEMPVNNNNEKPGNNKSASILLLVLLIGGCGIYRILNNDSNQSIQIASHNTANKTKTSSPKSIQSKIKSTTSVAPSNNYLTTKPNKETIQSPTNVFKSNELLGNNESLIKNTTKKVLDLLEGNNAVVGNRQSLAHLNNMSEKQAKEEIKANQTSTKENEVKIDPSITTINNNPTTKQVSINSSTIFIDSSKNTMLNKQNNVAAIPSNAKKVAAKKQNKWHIGLEWNLPVAFHNKSIFAEVNARNKPLLSLVPAIWLSKKIGKKSSLQVSFNPYSQVLLNSRSTLRSENYFVGAVGASTINQRNSQVSLAQNFTLYKVIGLQATIQYQHFVSDKWIAGVEIGNTWTKNALINESLLKNKTEVLKDSLYGVTNTDKDWQYINKTFFIGKVSLSYKMNRCIIGASFMRPLTNIYKSGDKVCPINTQVFFRYRVW